MIEEIFNTAHYIKERKPLQVLSSLMEEVGELATEVAIWDGHSTKTSSEDGVLGEAIDVIICAVDLIYITHRTPEEEIHKILKEKLAKWYKNKKE